MQLALMLRSMKILHPERVATLLLQASRTHRVPCSSGQLGTCSVVPGGYYLPTNLFVMIAQLCHDCSSLKYSDPPRLLRSTARQVHAKLYFDVQSIFIYAGGIDRPHLFPNP